MSDMTPPEKRPEESPLPSYEIEQELGLFGKLVRSWWFWATTVLAVIVTLGAIYGPGLYRDAKAKRALRMMDEGDAAIAAGNMREASAKYRQAQMLAPGDEKVQERSTLAAAFTGDSSALADLQKKWSDGRATDEEVLVIAEQLRTRNRGEDFTKALASLPPSLPPKFEGRRAVLVVMQKLAAEGSNQAIAKAAELSSNLPGSEGDELRLIQAELLLRKTPPDESAATAILQKIAQREDLTGIRALRLLGTYRTSQPKAEGWPTGDLMKALRSHKASSAQDEILALQIDDRSRPGQTEAILEDLIARKKSAPLSERTVLSNWLCVQQQYAFALRLLPEDEAKTDQDALLSRLEALSGEKQWSKARGELADIPTTILPAALRFLFLARCDEELGDSRGAEEQWGLVRRELRGTDPASLRFIANQAEARGRRPVAAAAFRAMSQTDTLAKEGLSGMLRTLPVDTPADQVIAIYSDLLALDPNNLDALAGQAYFQLLGRIDTERAAANAAQLLRQQPDSLPIRAIAALAALRSQDPKNAASILDGTKNEDWAKTADRWKVIRIAVTEANGGNAAALREGLRVENLRPEEATLLAVPLK